MTLIVKAMRIGFTESSNGTVIIDEYIERLMNVTDGKYLFIIIYQYYIVYIGLLYVFLRDGET